MTSISNSQEIDEALHIFHKKNVEGLMKDHKEGEFYRPKENETLLRRYRDLEFELARLIAGWIPSTADFNLKMQLGRQAFIFCKIVDVFSERLKELPGNSIIGNDDTIKKLRLALEKAPSEKDFLIGIYYVIQKELLNTLRMHLRKCDPIADWPTIDRLEDVIDLISKQMKWVAFWVADHKKKSTNKWKAYVYNILSYFGGIDGRTQHFAKNLPIYNFEDTLSVCYEPARLEDGYFVTEEFKFKASRETEGKITDILFQNFTEMFVPDSIAYMVYDTEGMPYEFYKDYIKQIWDECRHICMGMRELARLGIDIKKLPINTVKREKPYTIFLARLCYTGEGCSFPRKLEAASSFYKHGLSSAAIITEYDIVDESSHVKYAQKWLPTLHKIEMCEELLPSIIERVQKESLSWVTERVEDYKKLIEKLHGKFVKFGAFCKATDFKIDFDSK